MTRRSCGDWPATASREYPDQRHIGGIVTHIVILAGGWGVRLWPMSNRSRPKQLLSLGGDSSLLARTLARVAPLAPPERVLAVTSELLRDLMARELAPVPDERVVGEPTGRNTAPAIALVSTITILILFGKTKAIGQKGSKIKEG